MHVYTYTHIRMYAHIHKLLNIEEPSGPPEDPAAQLSLSPPSALPSPLPPQHLRYVGGTHVCVGHTCTCAEFFHYEQMYHLGGTPKARCLDSAMLLCADHAQTMRILCAHHTWSFVSQAGRSGKYVASLAHSTHGHLCASSTAKSIRIRCASQCAAVLSIPLHLTLGDVISPKPQWGAMWLLDVLLSLGSELSRVCLPLPLQAAKACST